MTPNLVFTPTFHFRERRAIDIISPPDHIGKLGWRSAGSERAFAPSRIGDIAVELRRALDSGDYDFVSMPVNIRDDLVRPNNRGGLVIHMDEIAMLGRLAPVDAAVILDHRCRVLSRYDEQVNCGCQSVPYKKDWELERLAA